MDRRLAFGVTAWEIYNVVMGLCKAHGVISSLRVRTGEIFIIH